MKKIIFALLCVAMLCGTGLVFAEGDNADYITSLLQGEDGSINPDGLCSRALIVNALYRMDNSPEADGEVIFDDIENIPYKDAIAWAAKNEIAKGYGDNTFAPDDSISKEQFAAFLFRYANYKEIEFDLAEATGINDEEISDWAKQSVCWAIDSGIISDAKNPKSELTVAQTISMLDSFRGKLPMSYAEFKALSDDEQKETFANMSGKDIYYLVKNSDENWPVTSYDLISPENAKETIVIYDSNGALHFNLDWPCYGGFVIESIASIGDLEGSVDVSRDGGDGGHSLSYGKNDDGSYPNDSQRSVPKTSAHVRTGVLNIDEYKKVADIVTGTEEKSDKISALAELGYSEEIAEKFIANYEAWLTRDEIAGANNISDGIKLAGNTVEDRYGYYGETAPWKCEGLDLEGGSGQMCTIFNWGTLCASGLISDISTADIN